MTYLNLFWTFLMIGAVSFGGGYAMLPLFERMVVETHGWLSPSLFIDMIALAQVTPGPIAINSATFIGYQSAGVLGSVIATISVVLIPVILVGFVSARSESFKENKHVQAALTGLRPALVGLIFSSVVSVARSAYVDLFSPLLFVGLMALLWKAKLHPILVIVVAGVLGFIIYY